MEWNTFQVISSHSLSPLTLDGTLLKESANLVILWVAFGAKMNFEKRLRSVSSAAAQRLGSMRKSWQVFHDWSFLLRSFWRLFLPVLEYCSAVRCSAAGSHLKLLDRVVRVAVFLADGVLECNLAHRRSVAVLCRLFKIRVTQCILRAVHCLCRMCRRVLLVVLWLLIGTRLRFLAVLLLTTVESSCPSQCLFGTIFMTPDFMVWDWLVLRAEPMLSCWPNLLFLFVSYNFLVFFIHGLVVWGQSFDR